MDIQNIVIYVT